MTDKQIIIDGVNVAECEFAVKPINDNGIKCHCAKGLLQIAKMHEQPESIKSGLCENNPNCYYKQLKHKEQECERLKDIIETKLEDANICDSALNYINDEYIYVKRQLEAYKMEVEEGYEINAELKADNEELKRANLHIENNREHKANKLNRIEKLILACTTGYTDEFIQELLVILHEPEPSSFENKYKQTLAKIKEVLQFYNNTTIGVDKGNGIFELEVSNDNYGKLIYCYDTNPAKEALQKISEVE